MRPTNGVDGLHTAGVEQAPDGTGMLQRSVSPCTSAQLHLIDGPFEEITASPVSGGA
jgi:hypothetical protein